MKPALTVTAQELNRALNPKLVPDAKVRVKSGRLSKVYLVNSSALLLVLNAKAKGKSFAISAMSAKDAARFAGSILWKSKSRQALKAI